MTMIERAARAIYDTHPLAKLLDPPIKVEWPDLKPEYRQQLIDCAKAAIEAMREPTGLMWIAGAEHTTMGNTEMIYTAMIDAALKE